jgi:hypothetical protein
MPDLVEILHQRLAAEPAQVAGAGVMAEGWDEELDEQRSLARGGKELLAGVEAEERDRSGISSLKVKYNKVFGYFIEVSKANLDRVPENYDRRQTLTNAERFTTPELKDLESRILSAEEQVTARDRQLYQELVAELSNHAGATADRPWPKKPASRFVRVVTRFSKRCSASPPSFPTTVVWMRRKARSCCSRARTWAGNRPTSGSAPSSP